LSVLAECDRFDLGAAPVNADQHEDCRLSGSRARITTC
jgi:hypothetical protein